MENQIQSTPNERLTSDEIEQLMIEIIMYAEEGEVERQNWKELPFAPRAEESGSMNDSSTTTPEPPSNS